jgi:hypothetical protein
MDILTTWTYQKVHKEWTMAERARILADRFEQAVAEFVLVVEGLTRAQWQTLCPNEERSVGVLARHVAFGIPFEMDVFREIAAGQQPATITRAELAEMNARDAETWSDTAKDETLALLRSNAVAAATEVRQLTDEQLARSGKYIEEIPTEWTVEQWLERVLTGHVDGHLQSIRAALTAQSSL